MNNSYPPFIQEVKRFYQPYYEEALTDEDAKEIYDNSMAFVNLLLKWDRRKRGGLPDD